MTAASIAFILLLPSKLLGRPPMTASRTQGQRLAHADRTTSSPPGLFDLIDRAFMRNEIDSAERIIYRVAAVRSPETLPEEYRVPLPRGEIRTGCHTPVFVEAFQQRMNMDPGDRKILDELLLPPPDLDLHIDATSPFPVRVSYSLPEQEELARTVLEWIGISWQREVAEMGWWEPPIQPPLSLYRFYIADAQGASGYTVPYEYVPDTEHSDAYTYIVIHEESDPSWVGSTVAHEFVHACQASMDAAEVIAFWENTAVFIEPHVSWLSWFSNFYLIACFQAYPHRPLEYKNPMGTDGYEYGGALWVYFLDEFYGGGDPVWVREIWEGTVQNGWVNEPDYFDVLDERLADQGGIGEAVRTFAQHRYFMGQDDDGQHLSQAYRFWDTEVARLHSWTTAELPVLDQTPPQEQMPQPNGCNYITIDVNTGDGLPLRFSFLGQPDLLWNVDLLRVVRDHETSHQRMILDAEKRGSLISEPSPGDRLVLVVCQVGWDGYDPDDSDWPKGEYFYSIDVVGPKPTVTSIDPSELLQGIQNASMTVHGSGFVDHPDLTVAFSGQRVVARIVEVRSSTELALQVTVGGAAETGARDVIVTNPGGNQGFGPGLLMITSQAESVDGGLDPPGKGRGCGCGQARSERFGAEAALFCLLLLLLLSFRSRPCRSRGGQACS